MMATVSGLLIGLENITTSTSLIKKKQKTNKVWAHKTSFTTPLFLIELPVSNQESELSCICVLKVSIVTLSAIFLLNFGTAPTV